MRSDTHSLTRILSSGVCDGRRNSEALHSVTFRSRWRFIVVVMVTLRVFIRVTILLRINTRDQCLSVFLNLCITLILLFMCVKQIQVSIINCCDFYLTDLCLFFTKG